MTALLLDTHVLIWAAASPARLRKSVRAAIADPANDVFVSVVSGAEIEIKRAIGKLRMDPDVDEVVESVGAKWLELRPSHVAELRELPMLHRDPFDRLLIAQALADDMTFVSADANVVRYDVSHLRAV